MKNRLERRYGFDHLHFITCSCYRRRPLLGTPRARDAFLKILSETRDRCHFGLWGYVVMPEHIHLLISEPVRGTPTTVMQILKQRVSRALRHSKKRISSAQMRFWNEGPESQHRRFWQRRFYDFNVFTVRKKNEKMNYMHFNPVKRGLVKDPKHWPWSSHCFYAGKGAHLCRPNPEWKPTSKPKDGKTRTLTNQRDAAPSRSLLG